MGWLEVALEMAGAKNVRITEPKCRARGDEYCEFEMEWQ
jgi:predicted hydrocarbon binding protein